MAHPIGTKEVAGKNQAKTGSKTPIKPGAQRAPLSTYLKP